MEIVEYAWLAVRNGELISSRPAHSALSELTLGAPINDVLLNLAISEWRRSDDVNPVPVRGEAEIEIQRIIEYYPPNGLSASVSLDDEQGSLEEKVRRVQGRYEVNGWDLHQVIFSSNMGPRLIFTKPEGAPDHQPFLEPNLKG